MIKLPLLLLCLFGIAAGSVRKLAGINGYISDHPDERCDKIGEFLLHPFNRCSYLVCDYGHEPWKDAYGNTKYYARIMKCAPGTAVPKSAYNEGTQKLNPHKVCTEHYSGSCPARVNRLTGNFFGGARYTPRYDSDGGYGGSSSSRHSTPSFSLPSFERTKRRHSSYEEPQRHSSFSSSSSSYDPPSHGSGYGLRRHGYHNSQRFGRRGGFRRNSHGHGSRGQFYKRSFNGGSFIYPKSYKENEDREIEYRSDKRYENEPTDYQKPIYRKPEKTYERPTYAPHKRASYRSRSSSAPSYGPPKRPSYGRPPYSEDSSYNQDPPTKVPYRAPEAYTPSFVPRRSYESDSSYSQKEPSYRPRGDSYKPMKSSYEQPSSSYESANTYDKPGDVSYPKPPSGLKYPGPPSDLDYPKAPEYSSTGYHPLAKGPPQRDNRGYSQHQPEGFGLKNRYSRGQKIYPRKVEMDRYDFNSKNSQGYKPDQYKPHNPPNRPNNYQPHSNSKFGPSNNRGPPPPHHNSPNQYPPKPQNNQYPQPNKHFSSKPNFPPQQPRYTPGPPNHRQPPRQNMYTPKPNQFPRPPHQNQYNQPPPPKNQYNQPPPPPQRNNYQPPPPPPQNQYNPPQQNQYPPPQQNNKFQSASQNEYPAPQQNQYPPQHNNQQGPQNHYQAPPQNKFPPQPHQNQGRY